MTVLFEYDRGQETAEYVSRTKLVPYVHGLDGLSFSMVVFIAESEERLEQLRERARRIDDNGKFVFVLREAVMRPSWSIAQWF